MILDPPEVVLKYNAEGDDEEWSLRLYAAERVKLEEETNPDVRVVRRSVIARREERARAVAEEQEQARLKAEAPEAEEEIKKELAERLARQKVIRIEIGAKKVD